MIPQSPMMLQTMLDVNHYLVEVRGTNPNEGPRH